MGGVTTVVKSVKESSGYVMMSGGGAMTQSSIDMLQLVGFIIGAGGLVVAVLRWMEAKKSVAVEAAAVTETKRANDLEREKWEYEKNAKSKDNEKANTASKNSESKAKTKV